MMGFWQSPQPSLSDMTMTKPHLTEKKQKGALRKARVENGPKTLACTQNLSKA